MTEVQAWISLSHVVSVTEAFRGVMSERNEEIIAARKIYHDTRHHMTAATYWNYHRRVSHHYYETMVSDIETMIDLAERAENNCILISKEAHSTLKRASQDAEHYNVAIDAYIEEVNRSTKLLEIAIRAAPPSTPTPEAEPQGNMWAIPLLIIGVAVLIGIIILTRG